MKVRITATQTFRYDYKVNIPERMFDKYTEMCEAYDRGEIKDRDFTDAFSAFIEDFEGDPEGFRDLEIELLPVKDAPA